MRVDAPPLIAGHVAELVPLRQRRQASQPPQRSIDVRWCARVAGSRGILALVRVERLVPPIQLLIPRLLFVCRTAAFLKTCQGTVPSVSMTD